MSEAYNEYIKQHKQNVHEAFCWIKNNIPEIFADPSLISQIEYQIQFAHDSSKNFPEEYAAYDAYFYGNNRSYQVVQDFNYAWLHHIHNNPHHWQHWILNNDDPDKGEICLKIPDNYVVEMVCDWWSFSFAKGNLREIFDWYDQRKNYIKLNQDTRHQVEAILKAIGEKLNKIEVENMSNNISLDDENSTTGEVKHTEQFVPEDLLKNIVNQQTPNDLMNGIADAIKNQIENKE